MKLKMSWKKEIIIAIIAIMRNESKYMDDGAFHPDHTDKPHTHTA